jgi:tol-pal system protein YbgF
MLKTFKIIVVILVLTLMGACTGTIGGGSSSMQRELEVLKMEVADLKDRARSTDMKAGGVQGGGDLRIELDNMRASLQRVIENTETASLGGLSLRQQLEYLSARIDRLEKKAGLSALNQDIVSPSAPIPTSTPVVPTLPNVYVQQQTPSGSTPSPGTEFPTVDDLGQPLSTQNTPPVVAKSLYDEGKELFDQKNYKVAIERLKAYIGNEPKGAQVASAQYYIAESLYFQNQFEDSILEYQTLVSGYPKNSLVSAALLKQGLAFQALGDKASAKLLYQKVVRDHPKSYAAGVAKERLKTI